MSVDGKEREDRGYDSEAFTNNLVALETKEILKMLSKS